MTTPWYTVDNVAEIPSPALLIFPDRVEENIRRMIRLAGGVGRLRPHMKTNKLPEVIRMHLAQGITRFKCATIAEAEMIATSLAPDVLLAYQPERRSQRWPTMRTRSGRSRARQSERRSR